MKVFLWSCCDRLTMKGFCQKQGRKYEQVNVFILRATINLTTLCIHVSYSICFGRFDHQKVDFATYLENNRPTEVKVSHSQLMFVNCDGRVTIHVISHNLSLCEELTYMSGQSWLLTPFNRTWQSLAGRVICQALTVSFRWNYVRVTSDE